MTPIRRFSMVRVRYRFRRRASVLLLAALLLVPVVLSGHSHARESTHPCSICAVTHHAPIVSTPALQVFTTELARPLIIAPRVSAGTRLEQAPRTGRAPPLRSLAVVA